MPPTIPKIVVLTEWVMKIENGKYLCRLPDGRYLEVHTIQSPFAGDSKTSRAQLQLLMNQITSKASTVYIFNDIKDLIKQAKTMSYIVIAWE